MGEIYKLSETKPNWIKSGIYKITFPNGKYYIGLSSNIRRRMFDHNLEAFRNDRGNLPLHNAIRKYGKIEEFEILEFIDSNNRKQLAKREMYWIAFYHSNDKKYGYNVTEGGEGTSIKGCKNHAATLNENQLQEVIDLLLNSNEPMNAIAKKYNVHSNVIININYGKTYYNPNINYPIRSKEKAEEIKGHATNLAHAKISDEDVEYIKYLLEYTDVPMSKMANEFNVDSTTILAINIGKTRKEKDREYPIRDKERAKKISNSNKKEYITEETIMSIIEELKDNTISNQGISKKYNIGISTVTEINYGRHNKCPKNISYPIKKEASIKKKTIQNYNKEENKMDVIIKLLQNTNKSFTKIAEITGINRKRISKINEGIIHKRENIEYPIRKKK